MRFLILIPCFLMLMAPLFATGQMNSPRLLPISAPGVSGSCVPKWFVAEVYTLCVHQLLRTIPCKASATFIEKRIAEINYNYEQVDSALTNLSSSQNEWCALENQELLPDQLLSPGIVYCRLR